MTVSNNDISSTDAAKQVYGRLLDVAEELFCEKGFEGTSIRDITSEAKCNVASVNYHFGGKEKLYIAMFRRYMNKLISTQIENIHKVMNTDRPTLEQLLETLVTSGLRSLTDSNSERPLLMMMVREILNPHLKKAVVVDELVGKFLRVLSDAIVRLCPGLKPDAGLLCVYSIDGLVLHVLLFSDYYYEYCPKLKLDDLIKHIVHFTIAGIRAAAGKNSE
jgi:AcrR family transcriptional regulator